MKYIYTAFFLFFLSGCATSMTTMTDARAYNPGEIQVNMNMQSSLNSKFLGEAIDTAVSIEERFGKESKDPISEEQYRDWLDSILVFAMFSPAINPEIMARVGVTDKVLDGIDIGLRTNFNLIKGDVKLQFYESKDKNTALSFIAGYGHHLNVAPGLVELVSLTKFSRKDFDFQLLGGYEIGEFVKLSGGPRVILSLVTVEQNIPDYIEERLPKSVLALVPTSLFRDEMIINAGANGVLMLGYKYAFLALDFGVFYSQFKPLVIGKERDYSGVTVAIAGGLSAHFNF